jgi:hypothetical protein
MVGLRAGQTHKTGAEQAYQTHIQKRSRNAANVEVIGRDLTGPEQNLNHSLANLRPIRHTDSRHNKAQGDHGKKQPQELTLF